MHVAITPCVLSSCRGCTQTPGSLQAAGPICCRVSSPVILGDGACFWSVTSLAAGLDCLLDCCQDHKDGLVSLFILTFSWMQMLRTFPRGLLFSSLLMLFTHSHVFSSLLLKSGHVVYSKTTKESAVSVSHQQHLLSHYCTECLMFLFWGCLQVSVFHLY